MLSARVSCTPAHELPARIAVLSKVSGNWTFLRLIRRSAGQTNLSTRVAFIWDICLWLIPTSICVYTSGATCRTSMNYVQNTLGFDESRCKSIWMKSIKTCKFHQLRSLKNKFEKHMLASRICCLQKLKGESGMMIMSNMFFFHPRSEESNRQSSTQCMFCYYK